MKFLRSKGVQGFIVAALSMLSMFTGVTIDPAIVDQIFANVESLVTIGTATAGLIWGVWGRITAKKPLIGPDSG